MVYVILMIMMMIMMALQIWMILIHWIILPAQTMTKICDDCSSGTFDLSNDGADDDGDGICNSYIIEGRTVYIAGSSYNSDGNYTACYWVDGVRLSYLVEPGRQIYSSCQWYGIYIRYKKHLMPVIGSIRHDTTFQVWGEGGHCSS